MPSVSNSYHMKKLFLFLFCRWENWGWYSYLLDTQQLLAGVWRFQWRHEIKLGKITICYPIFRRSGEEYPVFIAAYRPSMVMNQEGKADIADFSCTLVLFVLDYGSLSNMNKSLTFFIVIVSILQNQGYFYLLYMPPNYVLCFRNLSLNTFVKWEV